MPLPSLFSIVQETICIVLKMKNDLSVIILVLGIVLSVNGKTFDYNITGNVESVFYGSSKEWPCYVALNVPDVEKQYFYHAANNYQICEFAERCRNNNIPVTLYGKEYPGSNSAVDSIEYANTNAKFWFRY